MSHVRRTRSAVLALSPLALVLAFASPGPAQDGPAKAAGAKAAFEVQGAVAVAFSPDGKTLAAARGDGSVELLAVAGGARSRLMPKAYGGDGNCGAVAFSPDGTSLVVVGGDQVARIYSVTVARALVELPGEASDAVYLPGGETIAVTSGSRIRICDAGTGRERAVLAAHEKRVESLAVASGTNTLVSSAEDDSIRVFSLETHAQLEAISLDVLWRRTDRSMSRRRRHGRARRAVRRGLGSGARDLLRAHAGRVLRGVRARRQVARLVLPRGRGRALARPLARAGRISPREP